MRMLRVFLLAGWIAGCSSTPSTSNSTEGASSPSKRGAAGSAAALGQPEALEVAKGAIDSGDLARARQVLGDILVQEQKVQAEKLLAEDNPQDALIVLEDALALAPKNPEVQLLFAESSLRVGEILGDPLLFEGALEAFQRAGDGPRALFGASRAARMLGMTDDALRYAERGTAALAQAPDASGLYVSPERTLAEACYDAYASARQAESDPARTSQLFTQTEDALSRLLGRSASDPWVWGKLADLYLWEGRPFDAEQALERGLDRVPGDTNMLDRLYQVAQQTGGPTGALAAAARYRDKHPEAPLGWWYTGKGHFDAALSKLADGPKDDFHKAEKDFRECRKLDADLERDCLGYEIMCRNAIGWIHYNQGDLDAAKRYFLSTEEKLPRGMTWEIQGKLRSAVDGLYFTANAYNDQQDWIRAAEIFDVLHDYEPENDTWANNAGFFNREAAVVLEQTAGELERAAKGEIEGEERLRELRSKAAIDPGLVGTPREKELFADAAKKSRSRAQKTFEKSYVAYLAAVELKPEDVRLVNDAALLQVYHLKQDLDRAEKLLLSCVEMGAAQLQDPSLSEDARFELENAWGDAYQNLGVLYVEFKSNPERALAMFEKSLEIGPAPRPLVVGEWIPRCRREIEARAPE